MDGDDPSQYVDYTGCGNTFDPRRPFPLQLITDSLRYWITEMHVDGFRFDLASALARSLHEVDKLSSFFDTIHQDPVISQTKLIAEPWDVGAGGYQVGEFPPLWTEWNGKYRDTVRSFWSSGADGVRDLAFRLTGSSDLYGDDGRLPIASINFVTAHDGFTMRDLVSYEKKHNEANGEDNRDGTDDNRSYNCGAEGEPAPPDVTNCAAAGPQPAQHVAAVDRCADAGGRRRAVANPARQQQRLLPGQRDCRGWTGPRAPRPRTCWRSSAGCSPYGAIIQYFANARSSRDEPVAERRRLQGPGVVPPGRARTVRVRTGSTPGSARSACTWTGADCATGDAAVR